MRVPGGVNCKGNVYKFPSVQDFLFSKILYKDECVYKILLEGVGIWRNVLSVRADAEWTGEMEK